VATVSQSPTLSELQRVFGGPGNLRAYYRNGGYVPNIPQNYGIADNPDLLVLGQFRGATNYVPLSAYGNNVSSFGSQKGTFTVGSSTCSISGGNGNVSYRLDFLGGDTNFPSSVSGNRATFTVTNVQANTTRRSGVYRWTVSDGISSAISDFTVTWN
jgi:hypothetical protein